MDGRTGWLRAVRAAAVTLWAMVLFVLVPAFFFNYSRIKRVAERLPIHSRESASENPIPPSVRP